MSYIGEIFNDESFDFEIDDCGLMTLDSEPSNVYLFTQAGVDEVSLTRNDLVKLIEFIDINHTNKQGQ